MKTYILSIFCFLFSFSVLSQVQLPAPSPAASVHQTVGITEIKITYSSPGVKDRAIWGSLEKWGVPWRAGANSATKISFSTDVIIDGKEVKAGEYSLFITPNEKQDWVVHLNTGNSVFEYLKDGKMDKEALMKNDVVSVSVKPKTYSMQERLKYHISWVDDNTAKVSMAWEKVKLHFDVKMKTAELTKTGVDKKLKNNWFAFASSAKYYLDHELDVKKAATWAKISVMLQPNHFYNKWVMALALQKNDKKEKALDYAKKAKEYGEKNPSTFYDFLKKDVEKTISLLSK